MSNEPSGLWLQLRVAADIYARVTISTGRALFVGMKLAGLGLLAMCGAVVGLVFLTALLSPLPSIFRSLVVSLYLAYILALFLSLISFFVEDGGKGNFPELIDRSKQLFLPVISVLFFLYLVSFTANIFLRGAPPWVFSAVVALPVILCNPLPEFVYIEGGQLGELIRRSYQVVRENTAEWFAPYILLVFGASLLFPWVTQPLALMLAVTHPLQLLEQSFLTASAFRSLPFALTTLVLGLLVFTWRGYLCLELDRHSRRQRTYRYRQQHHSSKQ